MCVSVVTLLPRFLVPRGIAEQPFPERGDGGFIGGVDTGISGVQARQDRLCGVGDRRHAATPLR